MIKHFDTAGLQFLRDSATWDEYLKLLTKLAETDGKKLGEGDFFSNFYPTMHGIKEVSTIKDYYILEKKDNVYKLNVDNYNFLDIYGVGCELSNDNIFYSSYGIKIKPNAIIYVKVITNVTDAQIIVRDFIPTNVHRSALKRFMKECFYKDKDHPFFRDTNISNVWWVNKLFSEEDKQVLYENTRELVLKKVMFKKTQYDKTLLYDSPYQLSIDDSLKGNDYDHKIKGIDKNYITLDKALNDKLPTEVHRTIVNPGNLMKLWYSGAYNENVNDIIKVLERIKPYRGIVQPIWNDVDLSGVIHIVGELKLPQPSLEIGNAALVSTEAFFMNWQVNTQVVVSVFYYLAVKPITLEVSDNGEWVRIEKIDEDNGWQRFNLTLKKSNIGDEVINLVITAKSTHTDEVPQLIDTATLTIDRWKPNVIDIQVDEEPLGQDPITQKDKLDITSGKQPRVSEITGRDSNNPSEDEAGINDKYEF